MAGFATAHVRQLQNCRHYCLSLEFVELVECGSGFTAANCFNAGETDRGWKAAPTIDPKHRILIRRLCGDVGEIQFKGSLIYN